MTNKKWEAACVYNTVAEDHLWFYIDGKSVSQEEFEKITGMMKSKVKNDY